MPATCAQVRVWFRAGDEDFLKNDVRTKRDLDGLGCLGDIGWYTLSVSLWAFDHDTPSQVQAHIGVFKGGLFTVLLTRNVASKRVHS